MNNIENAIETLQNYSPCSQENLYQAHQVAITALEKQIPKKAYYLNYGGHNVGNWNHGIACICDYKANYCRHCGQKLDWEEEDE